MAPARVKVDLKAQTFTLLRSARSEFEHMLAHIPQAERTRVGQLKHWSPKDEIAHLAYWIDLFASNIQAIRTGAPLVDTRDYRAMNDRAWQVRQGWSWAEIEQAVAQALTAVETQIAALSAEELIDAKRFTLEPDRASPRPLLHSLIYELIEHPNHHFSGLYRKLGDEAAMSALFSRSLQTLSQLGSARWSARTRRVAQKHAERLQTIA